MSKLPRLLVATTLTALVFPASWPPPAAAQEGFAGLCAVLLHQEQTELEDLALTAQQDQTRLGAAEEIFMLLDELWHNDLVERLPYLGVKHRRDVAALTLERTRQQEARQLAVLEQYRLACSVPSEQGQAAGNGGTIREAERYRAADCEVRTLDVAMFEVDLEYQQELLRSALSLRQNDVASRQQVLFAERDVELTQEELGLARRRAAACRQ
jgi:hypothetical protein